MTYRSPSYRPAECCNAECPHDREDEPCWGEVEVIDEHYTEDDSWWVHACQGHKGVYEGHPYEPEVQEKSAPA